MESLAGSKSRVVSPSFALFAIIALFVAAKLFFLLRFHLPGWDEAVYLAMGKYIYSGGASGLWEMIRPPGLPILLGWIWKLGLPYVFFAEMVAIGFGIGSILLTFSLAKKLFNRSVAVLAAALLAISPAFYFYSSHILTEIPSTFFALAAIYSFINKKYYLSGAMAAAATLLKFPHALLIFVIAATVFLTALTRERSNSISLLRQKLSPAAKATTSFTIVTVPFLAFNYLYYHAYLSNAFHAIFRPFLLGAWHQYNPAKAINDVLYSYAFYAAEIFRQHLAFVLLLPAAFLFFKKKWFRDSGKLLLALFLVTYFVYFSYIPNKDVRFLLLFLPAVCILSAAVFVELVSYFKIRFMHIAVFAAAALLILSFYPALLEDFSFYRWRPPAELPIVSELYRSISRLGITGPVLTSEPIFAYYNDNIFFHYYDSSRDIPESPTPSNEWEQGIPVQAVIYSPQTLYCPAGDLACEAAKIRLYNLIRSSYVQVFNASYYDSMSYYVFVNSSMHSPNNSNNE